MNNSLYNLWVERLQGILEVYTLDNIGELWEYMTTCEREFIYLERERAYLDFMEWLAGYMWRAM